VWAAASCGYQFRARSPDDNSSESLTIKLPAGVSASVGPASPPQPNTTTESTDHHFKKLETCEFSSARARMSVILELKNADDTPRYEIWTKGSDARILDALDKDEATNPADLVAACTEAVANFANSGLRTLVWAYKEISAEEYKSYCDAKHQGRSSTTSVLSTAPSNSSLRSTGSAVEELSHADQLLHSFESNLVLLAATAVEDSLQDEVPETIEKLRQAEMKVWVLTGDKQGTAINIAKSSKLIDPASMHMLILNVAKTTKDELEQDYEIRARKDLEEKLAGVAAMLEERSRRSSKIVYDANERKYTEGLAAVQAGMSPEEKLKDLLEDDGFSQGRDASSGKLRICCKPEDFMKEQTTLVVDGCSLGVIFDEGGRIGGKPIYSELWKQFQKVAAQMVSVTCCRAQPAQKAEVVEGIKRFGYLDENGKHPVCLAVGDGANDVLMILAAHVGIGISGEEGRAAVKNSDYAIAQFKFLQPLLLVHGRWSYIRNTFAVCYSFYKNLSFTPAQYWWAFESLSSGQKMYIEMGYQMFNVALSALPVLAYGIWEQDVNQKISMANPKLYKVGRDNQLYNTRVFATWLAQGLFHSAIMYLIPRFAMVYGVDSHGRSIDGIWYFGCTMFGACVIVINLMVAISTRYWFWVQHFTIWFDILCWWGLMMIVGPILSMHTTADNTGNTGLGALMYGNPTVWLITLLAAAAALLPSFALAFAQDSQSPAYEARLVASEQGEESFANSSVLNCGLCGCPCCPCEGAENYCGDGCVDQMDASSRLNP